MSTTELSNAIFVREFDCVDADRQHSVIQLRIGIPYKPDDATGFMQWRCDRQIIGLGFGEIRSTMGIDAIDALIMSIQLADALIQSYRPRKTITWLEQDNLGLIPPPVEPLSEEEQKTMRQDENSPFKQVFDKFFRNFNPEQKPPQPSDQTE